MAIEEAELFIKAVSVWAVLVRGELHNVAASGSALGNGPLKHFLVDPRSSMPGGNPDTFNLTAQGAQAGQPGDERQLEGSNQLII